MLDYRWFFCEILSLIKMSKVVAYILRIILYKLHSAVKLRGFVIVLEFQNIYFPESIFQNYLSSKYSELT